MVYDCCVLYVNYGVLLVAFCWKIGMVLMVDVEGDIGFLVCKIRIENVGVVGGWRSEGDISLLLCVKEGDDMANRGK